MAIGDYSKTTYANGVAPAINATNLNNNENKVKELDTAVDGLETTVSGNTYDIFTLETTVSGLEAREIPVSTASRIFDLTGDRTPPIPDDPAGVTYQNIQNFTSFPAGWNPNNSPTITYTGGRMRVVADGDFKGLFRLNTSGLCIARLRVISGIVLVEYSGGQSVSVTKAGGSFNNYSVYSASNGVFRIISGAGTAEYEIEAIYIGTGAYLSKTVDRAGVPWTNYGALPVDGPFGKGLQFNGAQYMQAPGPMIGTTGTIAFCMSPASFTVNQYPLGNRSANGGFGTFIAVTTGAMGVNFRKVNGTIYDIPIGTISINTTIWITVTYSSSEIKVYKNGVLYSTTPIVDPIGVSINSFQVGKQADVTTANAFTGTIYAIRADSRVWTDEEIARWSRDPYSEESVPIASTPTANAIVQWPSSGNFGAGSNLDADLLHGIAGNRYHKNVTGGTTDQAVNWDTLIENGSYSIIGATSINGTNGPTGLYGYGTLLVFTVYNMRTQIYIPHQSSSNNQRDRRIVFRNTYAPYSAWTPWAEIFSERSIGTNWPTALATALGTGWTTALAATYGSVSRIPIATKTGSSTGTAGDISADSSYLYVCTATNTWKRVALTSF